MVGGIQNGKITVPGLYFIYEIIYLYIFLQLDLFKCKNKNLTPFKVMKQSVKVRHTYKILNSVIL